MKTPEMKALLKAVKNDPMLVWMVCDAENNLIRERLEDANEMGSQYLADVEALTELAKEAWDSVSSVR